jgi:hypothetical protein
MILFLIIISIILTLSLLLIFVLLNIDWDKTYTIIKYIDNCKRVSIIGINNQGKYTNILNNPNDKILILFINNDDINASFINNYDYQLINKKNINRIVSNDFNDYLLLFAFNYRIYFCSPYRITSIQTHNTYMINKQQSSFFSNDLGYFMISSINPFIIHKINDINFKIIHEYMNISWINNYGFISIKSNPILINGIYWMIGSYKNEIIFILFDFINKMIINHFHFSIDFEIDYGLIYNKFKDFFLIPIKKNGKISIFKIKRNSIN